MDFPEISITNTGTKKTFPPGKEIIILGAYSFIFAKDLKEKIISFETPGYNIFGHINIGCRNKIDQLGDNIEQLVSDHSSIIADMHWGFLAFVCKRSKELVIINDIYGIYPLYYTVNESEFTLSNDFDGLARMHDSLTINEFGFYDYLLFNHTLKSRTLFREISQLVGYSKFVIDVNGSVTKSSQDPVGMINIPSSEVSIDGMCKSLVKNIRNNIDPFLPSSVPLTGGFDSKVIISAMLSEGNEFSTFTFGPENSPDHLAAVSTAEYLKLPHNYIAISDRFLADFQLQLDKFLRNHPNAPMFDTLLYYLMVKDNLPESNLITGQMGGELIVGPVLISELITTRTFAMLATVSDLDELSVKLVSHIDQIGFINPNSFTETIAEYASPLQSYMKRSGISKNLNIVSFLLKETYAKFFGTVFSNLFSKFNIINPMVDIEYLKELLNSEYRFTNKSPFRKAPLSHFISRQLYPKMVKIMQPAVLRTRMDRGYNLEDFLHWQSYPKPFLNYIKRHLLKQGSTTKKTAPALYLEMIKKLAVEALPSSDLLDLHFFRKDKLMDQITEMKRGNVTKFQEQKIVQLFTLHLILRRYSDKIKII